MEIRRGRAEAVNQARVPEQPEKRRVRNALTLQASSDTSWASPEPSGNRIRSPREKQQAGARSQSSAHPGDSTVRGTLSGGRPTPGPLQGTAARTLWGPHAPMLADCWLSPARAGTNSRSSAPDSPPPGQEDVPTVNSVFKGLLSQRNF